MSAMYCWRMATSSRVARRLPADLQGVAVGERHLGYRPVRIAVAEQQPLGLLVPDVDHVPVE